MTMDTSQFWEARARRFAGSGEGLQAICSYAMPDFYNEAIDITQRAALKSLIASVGPGTRVLDYGCGVGRWTRELARRGAHVTAVDFSRTMLAEAKARTEAAGLSGNCRFVNSDVSSLELAERFDVIMGVTVLQHVLGEERLTQTVARLARMLRPGGRMVLVEAAPSQDYKHCDTATFNARPLATYVAALEAAGLEIQDVRGVDPAPFKLWVVPRFRSWPRPLALAALALATVISLPVDLLLARMLTGRAWHKVVVATVPGDVL